MKENLCVNNILLCICAMILFSCAAEKAVYSCNTKVYAVNFDTIKMKHDFCYSNLFDSVTIIRLDNAQVMIGSIDKMDLYKDKLIILDERLAKGVFVFDKRGNFGKDRQTIPAGI
ncbi:6-bladed beta-propeller [Bacteroides cellulosilyticus]|uniref:6-bladed beta-propeller n=1 Tax=Bacteroides cellulosilyticus TaxID=246787 RepID=UPI001C37AE82|nr:6-bladed beta-propeller [Bacteroides cellulosilyticus]MBV3638741.1 6-bladed beta-propeller [Bacteroides cellulosilyticus]MBV3664989.1 6-bladed beta-propeller [Bacteroides cellulosilyticus]MBV3686919.1 6-bladed beta-propeller [Bacteroides cellulosilyticus]MBV3695711.1 6-bladed beta-propeller [Bacteroides cellulosilyticus]MBV3709280.1 6-bladed beta-propeller [Bacteroides cellulosilyticus]